MFLDADNFEAIDIMLCGRHTQKMAYLPYAK